MRTNRTTSLRRLFRLAACALALSALSAPAVQGQDETGETPHRKHRKIVVRTAGDGKPVVVRGFAARRAVLGVQVLDLTPELRRHLGVEGDAGVLVSRVVDASGAAAAGIEVGDVLLAVDGERLAGSAELVREISGHDDGDVVRVELWRDGARREVEATLQKADRPQVDIRELFLRRGEGDEMEILRDIDLEDVYTIDPEMMREAIESMEHHLEGADWVERIRVFPDREELMERIESLEERLRELEKELSELSPGD